MGVCSTRTRCAIGHAWSPVCRLLLCFAVETVSILALPHMVRAGEAKLCTWSECRCARATSRKQCDSTSANFEIRSFLTGPVAADVARHCEEIRDRLRCDVFELGAANWRPRCVVVLHASRESYARAVGTAGVQTVGSSRVKFTSGRVSQRRIDLLVLDVERGLAALPHELIHVLFADAFPDTPPPKWAEEGLALLVDSADKQTRHRRDLLICARDRTLLPLNRLIANPDYPPAHHRAAFYAQSLSLVEFLIHDRPPNEFVRFVRLALTHGSDYALESIYSLDIIELEARWQKQYRAKS